MTDISTIESAWLKGAAMFEEWREKHEMEFDAPVKGTVSRMMAQRLKRMPEEVQGRLREMEPGGWDVVERLGKNQAL